MDEAEQILNEFKRNFNIIASLQGRIAYLLMSVYAVNPHILDRFVPYNPKPIVFANMVYGTAVHIYFRPNMTPINPLQRAAISFLTSLSFNYSSMSVYKWLVKKLEHRPILLTLAGFLCGRFMALHLLTFLYHVDSRLPSEIPSDFAFDSIYL